MSTFNKPKLLHCQGNQSFHRVLFEPMGFGGENSLSVYKQRAHRIQNEEETHGKDFSIWEKSSCNWVVLLIFLS